MSEDRGALGGALRAIFGPSRDEVWRELSRQIGADFVERGMFKPAVVQARAADWIITMDVMSSGGNNSTTFTRIRAPYVNPEGLRFTLSHTNFFKELGKAWFGSQDMEVGDFRFDQRFIVQGNDPARIRDILSNPRIQRLALKQPRFYMTVKDDGGWFAQSYPDGVDELYFQVPEVIKDVPRLRDLFELFSELLNHLCHGGAAYQDDIELHIDKLLAPGGRVAEGVVLWEGDPPRHRAATGLGRSGDPRAVEPLTQVLGDDDLELRAAAVDALAEIGHPDAVPHLVPLLGHEAPARGRALRLSAEEALERLGEAELVEAFKEALAGSPDRLRAFGEPFRSGIIQALAYSLAMGVARSTRINAVRALGVLGATEALPVLRRRLRSTGRANPYGVALAETIAELEAWESLPRPAESPRGGSSESLPSPAGPPSASAETLPRSAGRPDEG